MIRRRRSKRKIAWERGTWKSRAREGGERHKRAKEEKGIEMGEDREG